MNAPVPSPENVPNELRERDQWLMWDASANAPRRPHWRGNFGVSWTDPDDWHTFDEAIEAASERDSWGVGYVFANANADCPRGVYGALDLDGCVSDDGHPKEWLPSLQPFFDHDAYMEFSPSDEGIHIPLTGFDPPDWWRDVHFTDDEHEGVEAYGSKFFTVTGDRLRGSGDEIANDGEWIEEWLIQAYKATADEDPTAPRDARSSPAATSAPAESSSNMRGEWLNESDVRDALRYIDPDIGYSTWRDIGFALADYFSSSTARSLYEEWSQRGNSWDDDAPDLAERIINESSSGGGRTIATVVYYAREGGWSMPRRRPETGDVSSEENAAVDADDEESGGRPTPDGFDVRGGEYGTLRTVETDEGVQQAWDRWTSFEIEVVEFLRDADAGPTDSSVEATLRVLPADDTEEPYQVTVNMTVFNEVRVFKNTVAVGRTTTFEAGTDELNRIRRFVGNQSAPTRIGVSQIGLYGLESDERTEWVTPNGVLTADGWAENPRHTFNGRDTEVARGWQLDAKSGDEGDSDAVIDALRLIPQTRLSDRFLPVLGWFYAAPLRPYIMRWEGEFNQLNVLGDTGSGKTTTLQTLSRMFGGSDSLLSATSTGFAVMSAFASSNALPIVFDEYKPADMADYEVNRFNEFYRKSTKGGTETRGRRDMGTDRFPLRAPVAVSGEQSLRGPAEQRRTILAEFSTRATAKYSPTREAFARLAGLGYEHNDGSVEHFDGVALRDHALAYYRFVLGLDESPLREAWHAAEQRVRRMLTDMGNGAADDVRDAEFRALQTVAFGIGTYRAFADEYNVDPTADPIGVTDNALNAALRRLVTRGDETTKRTQRSSHVDGLLGLIARTAASEYIEEGNQYGFVHEGKPGELLCVRLDETFDKVRQYARDHDLRGEDLLDTANDYRSRLRDAAETDDSVVVDTAKQVGGLNRTVAFHVGRAMESVEGFDRDMFGSRSPNKYVGFGVDADRMADANAAADGGDGSSSTYDLPPADADGAKANRERVIITLREKHDRSGSPVDRGAVVGKAADRFGLSPGTVRSALDSLVTRGEIEDISDGGGKFRPL
jgi:hypothetical protein